MIRRLFALIVLLALAAGGLYYWKTRGGSLSGAHGLDVVGRDLKDTALTGAVKTAFELNRTLKPLTIHVSTEDGVVTLRGDVPRDEAKATAERVATAVPDVRQVVNHLQVSGGPVESPRPERTVSESIDDQALEVQVRLALSLNRELKGADIKVEAYKRSVALSGDVSQGKQKALALDIARETPGVSAVTERIRVIGEQAKP
ncbi:MAG: BON domain-containing protein [Vicinamibacteria bacterium]